MKKCWRKSDQAVYTIIVYGANFDKYNGQPIEHRSIIKTAAGIYRQNRAKRWFRLENSEWKWIHYKRDRKLYQLLTNLRQTFAAGPNPACIFIEEIPHD